MIYIIGVLNLLVVDATHRLSSFLSLEADGERPSLFLQAEEDTDIAFDLDAETALASLDFYIDLKEDELVDVNNEIVDIKTSLGLTGDCEDNTGCEGCTLNSECVWCPSLNTCVEGTAEGTDEDDCEDFEYGTCTNSDCDAYTSCDLCLNNSACGWCTDSTSCVAIDDECSELYYAESDTNNYCPESATDQDDYDNTGVSDLEDTLGELQIKQGDLESDIEDLNGDKEVIVDIIESYPE